MDFSEKAYARQKFRSSRGRGRGGRGGSGRGGYHGGHSRKTTAADLDSNAFRYEDEVDPVEDGVVVPKSQGADLEALLEDAEVAFNQAFYRFRAQVQDITDEAPPLGGTHPEQLLAIDLNQLSASLAALPLHALLGLEPHYLEGLEPQDVPQTRGPPAALLQQKAQATPSRQTLHANAAPTATAAAAVLSDSVKLPAAVSPTMPLQRAGGTHVGVGVGEGYGGPTSQPAPPPPAPASTTAPAGSMPHDGGDDDDSELAALLMGCAPVRQALPQPVVQAATAPPPFPPALSTVIGAVTRYAGAGGGGGGLAGLAATGGHGGRRPGVITLAAAAAGGSVQDAVAPGGSAVEPAGGLQYVGAPTVATTATASGSSVTAGLLGGFVVRSGPAGPLGVGCTAVGPLAPGTAAVRLVTAAPPGAGLTAATASSVSAASAPSVRLDATASQAGPSPLLGRGGVGTAGKVVLAAASVPRVGEPRPGVAMGGGGGGGGGGGDMDEELARLLGLPVAVGGAKAPVPLPLGISAPAAAQVPHKLGVRPSTATLAPGSGRAAPTPQQKPAPAKSLDDWLNDL